MSDTLTTRTLTAIVGALMLAGTALGVGVALSGDVAQAKAMTAADSAAWARVNDDALPALGSLRERLGDVERLRVEAAEARVRLADVEARLTKAEADLTVATAEQEGKLATLAADLAELDDAPSDIRASGQLVAVRELRPKGEVRARTLEEMDPALAARVVEIEAAKVEGSGAVVEGEAVER